MKFFIPIPDISDEKAEERWAHYLHQGGAPETSRRVYGVTYEHDGDKFVVKVGETRQVYKRKTGPRGGHIRNAGHLAWSQPTGTVVSGIVDTGDVLHVWSFGPPFGGWASPSLVGPSEVRQIEYFD